MRLYAFLALLIVLIAGCSQNEKQEVQGTPRMIGEEASIAGLKEFEITVSHTGYNPALLEADKGDNVRIKAVASKGTSTHNHGITIDEYSINRAVLTEDKNSPEIIEFVADKQGEFRIYCKTCWDGPFGKNHPEIEGKLAVR